MTNLLSRSWFSPTGGATLHKHSGAGDDSDPAIPHVIVQPGIVSSFPQGVVSVGTTAATVASASDRLGLYITNCGTNPIYLHPAGNTPTSTNYSYVLGSGDTLEVPPLLASLEWQALRSTGTENVSVLEVI